MSGRNSKTTEELEAARIDELVRAARNEAPPPAFVRTALDRFEVGAVVPPARGSLSGTRPAFAMVGKPLLVVLALCFAGAAIETPWSSTREQSSRTEASTPTASPPSAPSTAEVVVQRATTPPPSEEGADRHAFDVHRLPSATATAPKSASGPRPMARRSESAGAAAAPPERSAVDSPPNDFAIELARLREARDALRAGRADEADTILSRYEKSFPNGVLLPEAKAMHVDVLLAQGKVDEALSEARAFVASHPNSPQAARMRLLIDRRTNHDEQHP